MSPRDWSRPLGSESGRTDVLEIPVPQKRGPEDAELEAVIRLNLRHGRAAHRFGLFVSVLAILSIPLAILLFVSFSGGARGAGTSFVLSLWAITFAGASITGLWSARLLAQVDAAARRVGAKRRTSAD